MQPLELMGLESSQVLHTRSPARLTSRSSYRIQPLFHLSTGLTTLFHSTPERGRSGTNIRGGVPEGVLRPAGKLGQGQSVQGRSYVKLWNGTGSTLVCCMRTFALDSRNYWTPETAYPTSLKPLTTVQLFTHGKPVDPLYHLNVLQRRFLRLEEVGWHFQT